MLKAADGSRLINEINAGAWKLEDENIQRVQFSGGVLLGLEVKRLIAAMPEVGVRNGCVMDLRASNSSTGSSVLFSLRSDRRYRDISDHNDLDIRIGQGVRVAGEPLRMDSIFLSTNFRSGLTFRGGRKIRHWTGNAIPRITQAPPVPDEMPEFESVDELLPKVEELCPITDSGMAAVLSRSLVSAETLLR